MITLFNRAELLITYDLDRLNRARDALSAAGIDYQYRTKDLASPSPFDAGSRSRTGSFGMNREACEEYKLYVRKDDLSYAQSLL